MKRAKDLWSAHPVEELAFFSKEMKILGVYPAHPFRATFEEAVG